MTFKDKLNSVVKSLWPQWSGGEDYLPTPVPVDPATYRRSDGEPLFEVAGSDFFSYKYENYGSAVAAYESCPPFSAITNRKAQAFTNGIIQVLNTQEKEATGVDAKKVKALLNKPNRGQSGIEFEAQGYIFQQLFGFNIIMPIKPVGFTDLIDASELWNIPASWIDFNATQENMQRSGAKMITEIAINFNGLRLIVPLKELVIIKDFVPSFTTLTFPGSKVKAMALPINNIIGAYDSRRSIINNRGALGILSRDPGTGQYEPMGISEDEKTQLQRDYRKYGRLSHQWHLIITQATLKWQSMGYSVKDLMLLEEVEEDTRAICAGTNFPPFILGLADTTFNNMNSAEKGLYQNSIIPDANNYYDQLTDAFGLEDRNLFLYKNFEGVPVLQEDKKENALWRNSLVDAYLKEWKAGACTLNEMRKALGDDPIPDERGKLYYDEYIKIYGQQQTDTTGQAQGTPTNAGATGTAQEGQAAAGQSN